MTKVMTSLPTSLLIFLAIEQTDMGKDTTAFRERFNAYKNGKSVSEIYDAGLPRYAEGIELPIEQMMPYILAVENPTKQGLVNGVWRPPTDSSKWDTHAIGGGLDIREENNPIVYNYLKSKGRLNNPYLTVAEEEMLRKQTFEKTTLPALQKMYGKYKDKISEKGYARLAGMKWQGHPYLMAITPDSITGKDFLNAIASGDRDLDSVFDAYYKYPANAKRYGARINADVNYWKNYSTPSNVEPKSELVQLLEQQDKEKFQPWSNYHYPDYSLSNPAPSTISSWNNPTSPTYNTSGLYARRATNNINNVVQDILFNDKDVQDALMDNLSKNVFGGRRLGFKNGKLPGYEDGTVGTALLKGGASLIPGVGTAIDAYDFYKQPSLDNLGYLMLSGIGDAAMFTGFGGPFGLTLKNIRNAAKLNKARRTVKALSETRKANDAIQLYEAKKTYNQSKAAATALAAETGNIVDTANELLQGYKNGKSPIHINPANRGKFNATKKRTGKTTEQLAHSSNPLTRKRAIFALNARKWHH